MNFEFKSTFNKSDKYSSRRQFLNLFRSIDHAFWITSVNILAFVVAASLYLQNYLIPGPYGSGPNGNAWVDALLLLARVWAVTTSYSLLRLVYICNATSVRRRASWIHVRIRHVLNLSKELILVITLQSIIIINLFLKEPRRSGKHHSMASLHPLTQINYNLIV
jgi:hypothetical protein